MKSHYIYLEKNYTKSKISYIETLNEIKRKKSENIFNEDDKIFLNLRKYNYARDLVAHKYLLLKLENRIDLEYMQENDMYNLIHFFNTNEIRDNDKFNFFTEMLTLEMNYHKLSKKHIICNILSFLKVIFLNDLVASEIATKNELKKELELQDTLSTLIKITEWFKVNKVSDKNKVLVLLNTLSILMYDEDLSKTTQYKSLQAIKELQKNFSILLDLKSMYKVNSKNNFNLKEIKIIEIISVYLNSFNFSKFK